MKILTITNPRFSKYGRILDEYDFSELVTKIKSEFPEVRSGHDLGIDYCPSYLPYEELSVYAQFCVRYWAGRPCQFGVVNGHNFTLNAREYHRYTEVIVTADDMVLILGDFQDIKRENGRLSYDTGLSELFVLPAGTAVELYQTTLHYAPCSAHKDSGYRSVCILPRFANGPAVEFKAIGEEDKAIRCIGTWVIAHPESNEARQGAYVGLKGENLNIERLLS